WRMKVASTYRAVQASAAGDSLHHQLCKGPVSLPGLLALLRSFAAPSPTPPRLRFRAAPATPSPSDATLRIQTCHDALREGFALAKYRKTYRFDPHGYNDYPFHNE